MLCGRGALVIGGGLLYAWICKRTGGVGIPCLFHKITGFYCPGCGISRMCMALLELDFRAAFGYNAAVMILLPAAIVFGLRETVCWLRTGHFSETGAERAAQILAVILLVLFGILRNIPAFSFLAP